MKWLVMACIVVTLIAVSWGAWWHYQAEAYKAAVMGFAGLGEGANVFLLELDGVIGFTK